MRFTDEIVLDTKEYKEPKDSKVYQFFHYNPAIRNIPEVNKYTAAMRRIDLADFVQFVEIAIGNTQEVTFELDVGVAKLHPNDQFQKSVGRHIAILNMKKTYWSLENATRFNDTWLYLLKNGNSHISLEVKENRPTVYLIDYRP